MLSRWLLALGTAVIAGHFSNVAVSLRNSQTGRVSTGRLLSPTGTHVPVGSFPTTMLTSPDHRFVVVTSAGFREQLTVLDSETGAIVSSISFNGKMASGKKDGLYFGLAFGELNGQPVLYASRGSLFMVSRFVLTSDGKLRPMDGDLKVPGNLCTGPLAGVAVDEKSGEIAVAVNGATAKDDHHGLVAFFDPQTLKMVRTVEVPGYPLDLLSYRNTTYAACERDGLVVSIEDGRITHTFQAGKNACRLVLSQPKGEVLVMNAGSDSMTRIDPDSATEIASEKLRPTGISEVPTCAPLGATDSLEGKLLYVALGDLNAVLVYDRVEGHALGLIPTGWYPTDVKLTPDGKGLLVTSAKGIQPQHPNDKPVGELGQYGPNLIEGTVSRIDLTNINERLPRLTALALSNARLKGYSPPKFSNPGIKHVIYVIKENRTYDEVYGDMAKGNGDKSLVLFGKDVTPNQHALSERFGLYDNFYDCAEVSADGWNWSTSGMINEFTARNVLNDYSGRRFGYDYEGTNGAITPDAVNLKDVAEAPCGYLWDAAIANNVSFRNYGMFVSSERESDTDPGKEVANKTALAENTDSSYRQFDNNFADSDLWEKLNCPSKVQMLKYGQSGSGSRFAEWNREFKEYVAKGELPSLTLMRLPRDHTAGTATGNATPRAMVADNDFAVGELVEEVSKSPFWSSTVICILEDDAQAGFDHVDCHRSTTLIISPFCQRNSVHHQFYNTDSLLRTIELCLGLPAMNSFDATADFMGAFAPHLVNSEPYVAIMPSRTIASEMNNRTSYRAKDSARLLARLHEESVADVQLNDILWHSIKGNVPAPRAQHHLLKG